MKINKNQSRIITQNKIYGVQLPFESLMAKHISQVFNALKVCITDTNTVETSMLWPSQNFLLYKRSTLI